jgi:hypothetical protein
MDLQNTHILCPHFILGHLMLIRAQTTLLMPPQYRFGDSSNIGAGPLRGPPLRTPPITICSLKLWEWPCSAYTVFLLPPIRHPHRALQYKDNGTRPETSSLTPWPKRVKESASTAADTAVGYVLRFCAGNCRCN